MPYRKSDFRLVQSALLLEKFAGCLSPIYEEFADLLDVFQRESEKNKELLL